MINLTYQSTVTVHLMDEDVLSLVYKASAFKEIMFCIFNFFQGYLEDDYKKDHDYEDQCNSCVFGSLLY